ncbi:hypothetical protein TNCV_352541 [Trichonephila clavipes]|nr:hypothetical protein TNCV_352541 [Trichonephila clavipes]
MILHVGYRSFSWIFFWTISSTTLAPDQLRLQSDDRLNLHSSENSTHAQSVQSNCDAHDTIANGQFAPIGSGHQHSLVDVIAFSSFSRHARLERDLVTWQSKKACYKLSSAIIMTLKSALVHSFLPSSSNSRIASTHGTSDSPIFPTPSFSLMIRLLQILRVARSELEFCIESFSVVQKVS